MDDAGSDEADQLCLAVGDVFEQAWALYEQATVHGAMWHVPGSVAQRLFNAVASLAARVDSGDFPNTAAALGRRGGLLGGPARARALTPTRRSAIARQAAAARWAHTKEAP